MTAIAGHLSVNALRDRYVSSSNACEARHFQTIWLLAKGHSVGEVAELTSFGERWIEQLAARYNAEGPGSLGDLRRRNGAKATVLKPELIEKTAGAVAGSAGRRRTLDEFEGRGLPGARVGGREGRGSTRLGGAQGVRPVDPVAASQEPERRHARRGGGVQKTYGQPRLQVILSRSPIDQSASTYPASEHAPSQDGDTRGPVLIKAAASSAIF